MPKRGNQTGKPDEPYRGVSCRSQNVFNIRDQQKGGKPSEQTRQVSCRLQNHVQFPLVYLDSNEELTDTFHCQFSFHEVEQDNNVQIIGEEAQKFSDTVATVHQPKSQLKKSNLSAP